MFTSYQKELTQEEMNKMQALSEKFTFNDLRAFLKNFNYTLILDKNSDLLDYDLFHWSKSQVAYFRVKDVMKVAELKRALTDLVTTKNKAWRVPPTIEAVNKAQRIASEFAASIDKKLKKVVKLFEQHDEELLKDIEVYGNCYVTFTADKFLFTDSNEVMLPEGDKSEQWQKFINNNLALRKGNAPKFKHGQVEHEI